MNIAESDISIQTTGFSQPTCYTQLIFIRYRALNKLQMGETVKRLNIRSLMTKK